MEENRTQETQKILFYMLELKKMNSVNKNSKMR